MAFHLEMTKKVEGVIPVINKYMKMYVSCGL